MDQNLNQADGKRPYQPPQLTTISLRPEEAVLGNCKIAGTGGPVGANCQPMGVACNSLSS
jgi:hypothetical protein